MTLKQKMQSKEKMIGMYVQLADISISRIAGLSGYDLIWVDTEHSYMSNETLLAHVMTVKGTGTPVIVRAPQDDLTATKRILEMGVDGIIFPMVRTRKDADRVIASTMYPPYGNRGFGPMNANDYGLIDPFVYTEKSQSELCRLIQIEHKDAVENLDEIMENPYIDGFIIGANDLAGSYGMLGEHFSDRISDVIRDVIRRLQAKGKHVAIAAGGFTDEVIAHWCSFGAETIFAGADFDFIREGARQNRERLLRHHKNV